MSVELERIDLRNATQCDEAIVHDAHSIHFSVCCAETASLEKPEIEALSHVLQNVKSYQFKN